MLHFTSVSNLDTDVVILPEDSPVPLGHFFQLFVRPVAVIPALLFLSPLQLLQPADRWQQVSGGQLNSQAGEAGSNHGRWVCG